MWLRLVSMRVHTGKLALDIERVMEVSGFKSDEGLRNFGGVSAGSKTSDRMLRPRPIKAGCALDVGV
jgi:hypothetical protein